MADAENQGGEGGGGTGPTIEERAETLGWAPKEKWRGDPSHWVDAQEFIDRGEKILPVLKANNQRLETDVVALRKQNQELTAAVGELRGSMGEFVEFQKNLLKEKLDAQAKEIRKQMRAARDEDGAEEQLDELEEQLDENRESKRKLEQEPPARKNTPSIAPEVQAWQAKNSWFGGTSPADAAKTAAAMSFGAEAKALGLKDSAFLEHIDKKIGEMFPSDSRRIPSKTESGRPSGGEGEGGSDKFSKLPPEAKAQAKADASRFVGKNKLFQTEKEWFAHFADQYGE
jgi:hypothetical protein